MKINTKNIQVIFDTKDFKIYRDRLYTKEETIVEHYCNTLNLEDEEEFNALHKLNAYAELTPKYTTRYQVITLSQAIFLIQSEWMSVGESIGNASGYEQGFRVGHLVGVQDRMVIQHRSTEDE